MDDNNRRPADNDKNYAVEYKQIIRWGRVFSMQYGRTLVGLTSQQAYNIYDECMSDILDNEGGDSQSKKCCNRIEKHFPKRFSPSRPRK